MNQEKSLVVQKTADLLPTSLFAQIPSFEKAMEIAVTLSQSTMVPRQYQGQAVRQTL